MSYLEMHEPNPIIKEDLMRIASAPLPWESLHNKSILITGGGGFLASYLVKSLLVLNRLNSLNITITCLVRNDLGIKTRLSSYLDDPCLTTLLHDVAQPLPSDLPHIDVIIHSASQASPKYYGIDPVGTLLANSAGTMNMLNHAVKSKSSKFLFFSSSEIYGIPIDRHSPIKENDYGYLDPYEYPLMLCRKQKSRRNYVRFMGQPISFKCFSSETFSYLWAWHGIG